MWLTKATPGATSSGYEWRRPGALVDVPDDHAAELLAIPDADFAPADPPVDAAPTDPPPARRRRKATDVTED